MNVTDKNILLTGATGGIGAAIATLLANQGARLLLTARKPEALQALLTQLPGSGHSFIAADLSQKDDRQRLVEQARAESIDILVNNAGINALALHEDQSAEAIERMVNMNLTVPMQLCQALIPFLKTRPQAAIVNIGSIMGSIGMPGSASYCASKFGLRGFTEALRRELTDSDIQVIYLAPRMTATAINDEHMVAMNRELGTAIDDPQWVAEQFMRALGQNTAGDHYLGWPEKLFVRVNGLLPSVVDKAIRKQLTTIQRFAQQNAL